MFTDSDQQFMKEALIEAKKGFDSGEVPVGAVLVLERKVIARSYNQVESLNDPSAHAELLCIRKGALLIRDWRLIGCTLYSTLEPCLMCAGASLLARVKRFVWGAPDLRHGAHGSFLDIFAANHPTHKVSIEGGLMEEGARQLMRNFFRKCRDDNKF